MTKKPKVRLAIQKKGRLNQKTLELLKEAGLQINSEESRKLTSEATNFPLEIIYLRDDDICSYVKDGIVDIGILGLNEVLEKNMNLEILKELDFARCRLSLAVKKDFEYNSLQDLNGQIIATSYPNILQNFLDKNQIQAEIETLAGSVEIAPNLGLCNVICDLVSSGNTLISNNLKEIEKILESQSVLIAKKEILPEKKEIIDKLIFRISIVIRAKNLKYIALNIPTNSIQKVSNYIPGMKNPTISPLKDPAWSSLQSVVSEDNFWEVVDKLKECGARDILVMPIEKVIAD